MRELTRQEYIDCFSTNDDKKLRVIVNVWNDMNPQQGRIKTTTRRATNEIMIFREQLPAYFETILSDNERNGVVYVDGFNRDEWFKRRAA